MIRGHEAHVILGATEAQYAEMLEYARRRGEGVDVSFDPNWHCHPLLGITGHLHKQGRLPHGHAPKVVWDHEPILFTADAMIARLHQEHYQYCNCVADATECCVPSCPCHG